MSDIEQIKLLFYLQLTRHPFFQARHLSSITRIDRVQIQGQRRNIEIDKTE